MSNFLEIINEIHNSMKVEKELLLDTSIITEDFLVGKDIIRKRDGHITYLDTELIGRYYLKLWEVRLILCLEHLEHLVLSNMELRELDLSSLKHLKTIELKSCRRDSKIYIAENENLENVIVDDLDLTIEGGPIYLYAHPQQVGKVFPEDIEDKCRNKEDYLVVTLYLAPPKHPRVASNDFPLKYLLRYKEAELADILKLYWENQPEYYTKYKSLEEASNHEKEVFGILLEVERRVEANFYISKNMPFDPKTDIKYSNLEDRVFHDARSIPASMTQVISLD